MAKRARPMKQDRYLLLAEVGNLIAEHFEIPDDPKCRSQWLIRTFRRMEKRDGERYLCRFGASPRSPFFVSLLGLERALPFDPTTQQTLARQVHENSEEIRALRRQQNALAAQLRKMKARRSNVPHLPRPFLT